MSRYSHMDASRSGGFASSRPHGESPAKVSAPLSEPQQILHPTIVSARCTEEFTRHDVSRAQPSSSASRFGISVVLVQRSPGPLGSRSASRAQTIPQSPPNPTRRYKEITPSPILTPTSPRLDKGKEKALYVDEQNVGARIEALRARAVRAEQMMSIFKLFQERDSPISSANNGPAQHPDGVNAVSTRLHQASATFRGDVHSIEESPKPILNRRVIKGDNYSPEVQLDEHAEDMVAWLRGAAAPEIRARDHSSPSSPSSSHNPCREGHTHHRIRHVSAPAPSFSPRSSGNSASIPARTALVPQPQELDQMLPDPHLPQPRARAHSDHQEPSRIWRDPTQPDVESWREHLALFGSVKPRHQNGVHRHPVPSSLTPSNLSNLGQQSTDSLHSLSRPPHHSNSFAVGGETPPSPQDLALAYLERNVREIEKECGICRTEVGPHEVAIIPQCHHIFCLDCLRHYVTSRLEDGHLSMPCPSCTAARVGVVVPGARANLDRGSRTRLGPKPDGAISREFIESLKLSKLDMDKLERLELAEIAVLYQCPR